MRINQHFRCIRDIINSCLLFFSRREIILRPKTPSVVSVMSAESFPGAVEVTCFFFFLPPLFLSPSLDWRTPPPSKTEGKKTLGFARIATWRGEAGCVCGENTTFRFGWFDRPTCGVLGEKPHMPAQKCKRRTSMRCPALIVLTKSSWLLHIVVTPGRLSVWGPGTGLMHVTRRHTHSSVCAREATLRHFRPQFVPPVPPPPPLPADWNLLIFHIW